MKTKALLEAALFFQVALTIVVLSAMLFRRAHQIFSQLAAYLAVEIISVTVTIAFLFFRRSMHIPIDTAYSTYFAASWFFTGVILIFRVLIVYSVFGEAMRPMAGLHKAGKIIFRWVGVVSALVALALLVGPGVFSSREAWANILSHLQQGVSVLTLCLLVFVCFAVRPLGLTFRSHIFGVSLGLGIAASVELIEAAWSLTSGGRSVYSSIFLFSVLGDCIALTVWAIYFAAPEPARKMILLPTTSPFFFWNRISEILGDSPGHVAVAGFTPTMLAPAEIEMLTAATAGDSFGESESARKALKPMPRNAELPRTVRPSLVL